MRECVERLLASVKGHMDQVRAVSHGSVDHYQIFVRSCCGDVPSELFRRLYLVNAFVKGVYHQHVSCVLHDSLLRELDDVVDVVLGTSFPSSVLVDCSCDGPCDWQDGSGCRRSSDSQQMRVPLTTEMTEAFQDWFLLRSRCRLEHRGPSARSSELEERKWAHWINSARYSSSTRAVEISIRVDWILLCCGCVRRTAKRFFPEDPSWPVLVEELNYTQE